MGIQDSGSLILREKSLKEFNDQVNKVVGQNALQFAVVDMTKGELYFVNSLNQKNLHQTFNSLNSNESDIHLWPNSPLLAFPNSQTNANIFNPNAALLHQDFANMKISADKKQLDPQNLSNSLKDLRNEQPKESVKSYFDLNPASRLSSNVEPIDALLGHAQQSQFGGSNLFTNF
mgnify:CR=1 FL=1